MSIQENSKNNGIRKNESQSKNSNIAYYRSISKNKKSYAGLPKHKNVLSKVKIGGKNIFNQKAAYNNFTNNDSEQNFSPGFASSNHANMNIVIAEKKKGKHKSYVTKEVTMGDTCSNSNSILPQAYDRKNSTENAKVVEEDKPDLFEGVDPNIDKKDVQIS